MTNYEKIKGMSVEELTEFLDEYFGQICMAVDNCGCCPLNREGEECANIKEWLESECDAK